MGNSRTGKQRKRIVAVSLDNQEYKSLQEIAKQADLTPSAYVRTLLNKRIQYIQQSSKRQGEVFYDYTA